MPNHRQTLSDLRRRFESRVDKSGACWLWLGTIAPNGYGLVNVGKAILDATEGGSRGAHRVAWLLEHGTFPPADRMLCHTCDVKRCVNPAHLYVGTALDNSRDSVERDRTRIGSRHPRAKINEEIAAEIRRMFSGTRGEKAQIARRFGITRYVVDAIVTGRQWRHVA